MLKTILATATAALVSFAIVHPASAGGIWMPNGVNPNGVALNGSLFNGARLNGALFNGSRLNGDSLSGEERDGMARPRALFSIDGIVLPE
ncbi:MAG TPA: hypothetical protein VLA02_18400 [Reyranella sp.]|nr:hypothetical protein [Reyranella sp.]